VSARALSIQSLSLFSPSSLRLVPTGPHTRRPQVQPYAVQSPLRDSLVPISSRSQDASARQLPTGPYSFFLPLCLLGSLLAHIHLRLYCRARCSALILGTPCTSSWLHHSTINLHLLSCLHSHPHSHSHSYPYSYFFTLPHLLEIVFAIPAQSELIGICLSSIL
jgi:hypothetical protein